MRKYLAIGVALTFLLFALGLMAQNSGASGQTSNPSSSTTSSQNPNSPAGDQTQPPSGAHGSWSSSTTNSNGQSTSSSGTNSGMQGSASSQSGTSNSGYGQMGSSSNIGNESGKTASMEGCVVREETDYFLIPKRGNPVRLNSTGSSDLSAHVGHRVKVHGNESAASNLGGGTSTTAGTSGTATGSTAENNPMSEKPSSGSVSGNASANPSGSTSTTTAENQGSTTGGNDIRSAATQEITVDRIDMVSESCPANWNTKWNNTGAGATPSSNPSNPK